MATILPRRGRGPRNVARRNLVFSFAACLALCLCVLLLKFKIKKPSSVKLIQDETKLNETEQKGAGAAEAHEGGEGRIVWEEPKLERSAKKVNPIKEIGDFSHSCSETLPVNNNVKYTRLQNVCVFRNGFIMNSSFSFLQHGSCVAAQKPSFNVANAVNITKGIFISHNFHATPKDRLTKEFPLLSLLPDDAKKGSSIIMPLEITTTEKELLGSYGYSDIRLIREGGVCCEELITLNGPMCEEYSQIALESFTHSILEKKGFVGQEPTSVVIAIKDRSEENEAKRLQQELEASFNDVSFLISPMMTDTNQIVPFWARAKFVIASKDASDGNEVWMKNGSILMTIPGSKCHTETAIIARNNGVIVYELFFNTKNFKGISTQDILPTVEEILINNKLTLRNKPIKEEEGDIF